MLNKYDDKIARLRLMDDKFMKVSSDPEEMKIPELKKISKFYKSEGGKEYMSGVFEEVKEEGIVEGKVEELVELVKDRIIDIEVAAKRLNMSKEEFSKLLQ